MSVPGRVPENYVETQIAESNAAPKVPSRGRFACTQQLKLPDATIQVTSDSGPWETDHVSEPKNADQGRESSAYACE